MRVTVKLLGALGDLVDTAEKIPVDFTLPDEATATDLISRLAEYFGGPFGEPVTDAHGIESKFPSRIQLFVDGVYSPKCDRRLAAPGTESTTVQVVIMKPITGG